MKRTFLLLLILSTVASCGVRGDPEAAPAFIEKAT